MRKVISWKGSGLALCAACLGLGLVPAPSVSARKPALTMFPAGSRERKAILDVIRGPVARELRTSPTRFLFKVNRLRALDGWAFLDAQLVQPNGRPFDFHGTPFEADVKEGIFGDGVFALFHRRGGKWSIVTHVLGPTDVTWDGWDRRYRAPRALFPYP